MALSRPSLVLAVSMSLFIVVFTPGGLYARFDVVPRFAIVFLSTAVFIGWAYLFLPRTFAFALEKRWPVVLLHSLLFIPPSLPFVALSIEPPFDWTTFAWYMGATCAVIFLTCAIGGLLFQSLVLPRTAFSLTSEELWTFGSKAKDDTAPSLPRDVVRLEAENQYTRVVTRTGSDLLPMTLGKAEDCIAPGVGLRVHRSHWVACAEIKTVGYKDGNPRLTLRSGETVPVSRKKFDEIRHIADRNAAH